MTTYIRNQNGLFVSGRNGSYVLTDSHELRYAYPDAKLASEVMTRLGGSFGELHLVEQVAKTTGWSLESDGSEYRLLNTYDWETVKTWTDKSTAVDYIKRINHLTISRHGKHS